MKKLLVFLIVLLLLGGGGFAAWWFYIKPPEPTPDSDATEASTEADSSDATAAADASTDVQSERTITGAAKRGQLQRLNIPGLDGWKSKYNQFLESWTYEKTLKLEDKGEETARFYVGRMPENVPTDMNEYAHLLRTKPGFQDYGYSYEEIDDTEVYGDGWLIIGKAKDVSRPDKPSSLSFVMYRSVLGAQIRCRGSALHTEAARKEAMSGCRKALFQ